MRKGHSSSSVGLCGLFFCPVCQTSLALAAPLKLSPGSISYISNTCEGYSTTISNTPGLSECNHALIGLSFLSSLTTNQPLCSIPPSFTKNVCPSGLPATCSPGRKICCLKSQVLNSELSRPVDRSNWVMLPLKLETEAKSGGITQLTSSVSISMFCPTFSIRLISQVVRNRQLSSPRLLLRKVLTQTWSPLVSSRTRASLGSSDPRKIFLKTSPFLPLLRIFLAASPLLGSSLRQSRTSFSVRTQISSPRSRTSRMRWWRKEIWTLISWTWRDCILRTQASCLPCRSTTLFCYLSMLTIASSPSSWYWVITSPVRRDRKPKMLPDCDRQKSLSSLKNRCCSSPAARRPPPTPANPKATHATASTQKT